MAVAFPTKNRAVMSLSSTSKPMAWIAPSSAVALPVQTAKIQLTVPWSEVTGWTAHGVDARGRPVRQSGIHRGRHPGGQTTTAASFELNLPQGFQGILQLQGVDRLPLGRIRLDLASRAEPLAPGPAGDPVRPGSHPQGAATPNPMGAQSHELDVRWLGPTELLVDRISQQAQCYVQLPPRLGVRSIVMRPVAGNVTQVPCTPRGASFTLPASFRGTLEAKDAAGVPQLALRIRHLFPTTRGVDVQYVADTYRASISRPGGILQVSVLPGSQRISIA